MVVKALKRLRRSVWTWRQPLTHLPVKLGLPVSDLFVWRHSNEWKTNFELIDISAFFPGGEDEQERYATIYLFDLNGQCFLQKRFDLLPNHRQTLNLAPLIGGEHGEIGTFAVFHSVTAASVTEMGAYLAERGYVSFLYRDAPLWGYVHGNLDAVSRCKDGQLELLGGLGVLPREFRLQHEMTGPANYELAIVNPTNVAQSCQFLFLSACDGKLLQVQESTLKPGGVEMLSFQVKESESVRLIIKSYLVMARPLIFRIQNLRMDVFHG